MHMAHVDTDTCTFSENYTSLWFLIEPFSGVLSMTDIYMNTRGISKS